MKIVILDGQGGGVGHSLVEALITAGVEADDIFVVGTNALATANMIKGFNVKAATGENAAVFNCQDADAIVGPIGIIMPNAMLGEVTPKMAEAVSSSRGKIVLIPMNRCHATLIGLADKKRPELIKEAVEEILG